MKGSFGKVLLALVALLGLSLTSCEGFDWGAAVNGGINIISGLNEAGACETYDAELKAEIAAEGRLMSDEEFLQFSDAFGDEKAFSMALVLNEDLVNRMFAAATEWNYSLNLIAFSIKAQLPRIRVQGSSSEGGEECMKHYKNCMIFDIPIEGSILGVGDVGINVSFSLPITDEIQACDQVDEETGETYQTLCTQVYADLRGADLLRLAATAGGKTIALMDEVKTPLITGLKMYFAQELGLVRLFQVQAWEVGEHKVKLIAGVPKINDTYHTLTFGMYTNMIMSLEHSVAWDETFPDDAELALHIHPELIRALIARMLHEGEVPRSVDLSDAAESAGEDTTNTGSGFDITLRSMNNDLWANPEYFNTGFRLWQTKADSMCGWMDIWSGLKVEISDKHFKFKLAEDIQVVDARGVGKLAGVLLNSLAQTDFFKEMLRYAEVTVNFDEIGVGDSKQSNPAKIDMSAKTFQFNIDGNGISLYLNVGDF